MNLWSHRFTQNTNKIFSRFLPSLHRVEILTIFHSYFGRNDVFIISLWPVDGSVFQGCKITPYYDSWIAKVICKGRNREEAIQRTLRSLDEFVIEGITTTIPLHKKLLNHKKFINSDFNVSWLDKEKTEID